MANPVQTAAAPPATLKQTQQALTAARHLEAAGEAHQYLTFALSSELYAVGILNVKEIIEYGNLTEIPMMPRSCLVSSWRISTMTMQVRR